MNNNASSIKIAVAETSVIIRSGLTAVLKRLPNLNVHPIEVSSPESLQSYIQPSAGGLTLLHSKRKTAKRRLNISRLCVPSLIAIH